MTQIKQKCTRSNWWRRSAILHDNFAEFWTKVINIESNSKFLRMSTHFNCGKCHRIMALVATYWKFSWKQWQTATQLYVRTCMLHEWAVASPLTYFTTFLYLLLFLSTKLHFTLQQMRCSEKINNCAFQCCNSGRRCVQAIFSKIVKKKQGQSDSSTGKSITVVAQHKPII